MGLLIAAILLVIVLVVLVRCIVIVPQSNSFVVERLGVYKATWEAGLHLKMPFIERVARRVSLKEEVADFPPQPVITRDNVTMMIDTVVFFQVFDAKAYAYGVSRPIQAIENLSATSLRDIIGSMSLDETLTSRDAINTQITATLDEATDRWGIKVNRIELKNIEPSSRPRCRTWPPPLRPSRASPAARALPSSNHPTIAKGACPQGQAPFFAPQSRGKPPPGPGTLRPIPRRDDKKSCFWDKILQKR